mmetsp:Transcript_33206/g.96159  ORF Transcript_33206/g.96159 Transcript_33206/m.96159 type:complete len:244 (-) Transcript_33206:910-1641(-)
MDGNDRVRSAFLEAGTNKAVHPVLHFCVPSLDRVEIKGCRRLVAHSARGCAATHADAVGRATDLHHEHPRLWLLLRDMSGIQLANTSGEHDGLDPLYSRGRAPSFTSQSQTERPTKAVDYRLSKLVPVVRRAVRRLDGDGAGVCQVCRVLETTRPVAVHHVFFPRQRVAFEVEISDAIGRDAGHRGGAPAGGLDIPESASGTGLRTGEGSHCAGEVVRLGGEDRVKCDLRSTHLAGGAGHRGS